MRQPDIYTASAIKLWDCARETATNGSWIPARPVGHNGFSWRWRFKLAFMVLIGKYDALNWQDDL